jgi:hypothetical protein
MRIGRAPDERVGVEPVIHGKVGHVLVHRVREATTDAPRPEDGRWYPYRQTVPSRFAANQARREA